jgi:ATP-binding cassette subfamily B protein
LLEIRDLRFKYPGGGREVLEGISLTINSGTTVGILGRTGSGKSTLLKTLTRMVDPPPDTVFVKGVPVGDWDLGELRSLFGVTPQDSYLFSDSIKHNIRYGFSNWEPVGSQHKNRELESTLGGGKSPPWFRPYGPPPPPSAGLCPATPRRGAKGPKVPDPPDPPYPFHIPEPAIEQKEEELLFRAAGLSALDQDLGSFAAGWDTLVGERGLTLSGGQKQRVAISRAVIGSPEILILDDSLSAVDAETEKRILTSLLEERRGKTTIIISHRVSTLRNADFVVVLDKGRICESGSPRELAVQGGFYARMAALQQLEQREDGGGRG